MGRWCESAVNIEIHYGLILIIIRRRKMKFLTVSKIKDVFYTLPQAEQTKLLLAAVESLLAYKKKMGDKWHFYSDPGETAL